MPPTTRIFPSTSTNSKKHNVKHLVRACDPTYSTEPLRREGIDVHDMPFPDGGAPSDGVIDSWLKLLTVYTKSSSSSSSDDGGGGSASSSGSGSGSKVKDTIGIHCVAGLGRAPVLVAIALIESGMPPLQAVDFIRDKRRGSINMRQLQFLKTYKSKKKGSCIVM
eukprot:TRINITY_DN60_c1_g1_i1.p2 TRINITY_DN60_c1_g1~~TRINITY_DN60_c1_g1_i1.p2  ORF type:complete len:165 (+),score=35.12 TRINITY_DN60_c1_g1_i1:253-747(+)